MTHHDAAVLAIVVLGEEKPDISGLSGFALLDLVEIVRQPALGVRLRRFRKGHKETDRTVPFHDVRLAAVEISLFLESRDGVSALQGVVVVGGESLPDLEAMILAFVDAPYVLAPESPAYQSSRLPALAGARAVLIRRDQESAWRKKHVIPAFTYEGAWWTSPEWIQIMNDIRRNGTDIGWNEGDGGLLIVSYFSPPATPVSVQRLSYWHSQIPEIWEDRFGSELPVTWATATARAAGRERVAFVPDRGPWRMSESWFQKYRELTDLKISPLGLSWGYWVERQARSLSIGYRAVVLSGNPFFYFDLVTSFKELWDSKVILDFRDPFAGNPRFNFTGQQRNLLEKLEEEWVAKADVVVSVNHDCLSVIAPGIPARRVPIANGFDERVVGGSQSEGTVRDPQLIRIAYSGTVFPNLPLDNVVQALDHRRHTLVHFGRDYSASTALDRTGLAERRGLVDYETLIPELMACDTGLVMTSGEPSTQTTKLFDYIACDLDIVIVTQGELRTGNLHEVTKGLEGVFWVRDDREDLKRFFSKYVPRRKPRDDRDRYSRRAQTERLLEAIRDVEGRSTP